MQIMNASLTLLRYFSNLRVTAYRIKYIPSLIRFSRACPKYSAFRHTWLLIPQSITSRNKLRFEVAARRERAYRSRILFTRWSSWSTFRALRALARCIFKGLNRLSLAPDQRSRCVPLYRSVQETSKWSEATDETSLESNSRTMRVFYRRNSIFGRATCYVVLGKNSALEERSQIAFFFLSLQIC